VTKGYTDATFAGSSCVIQFGGEKPEALEFCGRNEEKVLIVEMQL